jgi:hypothetical protein
VAHAYAGGRRHAVLLTLLIIIVAIDIARDSSESNRDARRIHRVPQADSAATIFQHVVPRARRFHHVVNNMTPPVDYVEESNEIRIARYDLVKVVFKCVTPIIMMVLFAWIVQIYTMAEYERAKLGLKLAEMERETCKFLSQFQRPGA